MASDEDATAVTVAIDRIGVYILAILALFRRPAGAAGAANPGSALSLALPAACPARKIRGRCDQTKLDYNRLISSRPTAAPVMP